MQVAGLTNQGLERSRNEDNCYAKADGDLALLVVADGMGGHRAGNVASAIAVETAEETWQEMGKSASLPVGQARSLVEDLLVRANRKILAESEKYPDKRGMGTTLTAGLLCGNRLTIGHVGDSRAYKIYESKIFLLTKDHSLIEKLVDTGQVSPEEAVNHPQRHVLTRALGVGSELEIDITEQEVETGSVLLLCSDGLTNMVRDEEILSFYNDNPDPDQFGSGLIELANARGGYDNITVVIASGIGGSLS